MAFSNRIIHYKMPLCIPVFPSIKPGRISFPNRSRRARVQPRDTLDSKRWSAHRLMSSSRHRTTHERARNLGIPHRQPIARFSDRRDVFNESSGKRNRKTLARVNRRLFDTSSALVPVFYGDHVHHQASLQILCAIRSLLGCCGAHSLAEVYSTLTRMPGKHKRVDDQAILSLLAISVNGFPSLR